MFKLSEIIGGDKIFNVSFIHIEYRLDSDIIGGGKTTWGVLIYLAITGGGKISWSGAHISGHKNIVFEMWHSNC